MTEQPESPFDSLQAAPWHKGTSNSGAGHFVVPDESSDEEGEDDPDATELAMPTPAVKKPARLSTIPEMVEEEGASSPVGQWSQPPPPTPAPAHASLPWGLACDRPQPTFEHGDVALARARLAAEKYKPKTPSGLCAVSRMSTPTTAFLAAVDAFIAGQRSVCRKPGTVPFVS